MSRIGVLVRLPTGALRLIADGRSETNKLNSALPQR
jgi:hypothetical protein